MFSQLIAVAGLASVALAAPQGVTAVISPSATAPANCKPTYAGQFNIEVVNPSTVSSKRDVAKRADALTITLNNGILLDTSGRTGYIAANYQFQFDKPAQTGAIYTAGWSACTNGSLALGGSNIFYQCLSGDFYNLYDRSWAPQCSPILIQIVPVASNSSATSAAVSQSSDGQVVATTAVSASKSSSMVGSLVTQITDGQIQATTAASFSSSSSKALVTQITDGQIQATTAASFSSTKASSTASRSNATTTSTGITMFTGAANAFTFAKEAVAVAAGAVAVALL